MSATPEAGPTSTVAARELGQVLAWLALDRPGILGALPAAMRADEWATEPRESMDAILELLHDYVKDLSARLWALEEAEEWTGKASVTIGAADATS